MAIELLNESNSNCDEAAIISLAGFAISHMNVHAESDLSITIVDEARMSELHVEWMGLEGPTDVLSFPMDELLPDSSQAGAGVIGDIVLCPAFAAKNEAGRTVQAELELLTVHGVLHCLGFDHAESDEHIRMFALQELIVNKWRAA